MKNRRYIFGIFLILLLIMTTNKSISQCANYYFYPLSCEHEVTIPTQFPLDENCMHWPAPAFGNFPHIAMYQVDMDKNFPKPENTRQFSNTQAIAIINFARAYWSQQCLTEKGLSWNSTCTGGRFYWSIDPIEIPPYTFARANNAIDPLNNAILVDSSTCSPSSPRKRSEIIFNNTSEMYLKLPQYKWTTTSYACDKSDYKCINFRSIALHELGHYVGLAHDGDEKSVMNSTYKEYRDFSSCDADRFRRFYCVPSVGMDPSDVKEVINSETVKLEVYPIPAKDIFNINFNVETPGRVRMYLNDINSKNTTLINDEYYSAGLCQFSYPTYDFNSGSYNLIIEFEKSVVYYKIVIVK